MSDEEPPKKEAGGGAPLWIVTFADLMSLLLTFFVLLLSFADLEIVKFKLAVGSLRQAFGVQKIIPTSEISTTTSLTQKAIGQGQTEFVPMTQSAQLAAKMEDLCEADKKRKLREQQELKGIASLIYDNLKRKVKPELDAKKLDLQLEENTVVVRFPESQIFQYRTANLKSGIGRAFSHVAKTFGQNRGKIKVASFMAPGNPDSPRFKNDWKVASQRTEKLARGLFQIGRLDPARVAVENHPQLDEDARTSSPLRGKKRLELRLIVDFPEDKPRDTSSEAPAEEGPKEN